MSAIWDRDFWRSLNAVLEMKLGRICKLNACVCFQSSLGHVDRYFFLLVEMVSVLGLEEGRRDSTVRIRLGCEFIMLGFVVDCSRFDDIGKGWKQVVGLERRIWVCLSSHGGFSSWANGVYLGFNLADGDWVTNGDYDWLDVAFFCFFVMMVLIRLVNLAQQFSSVPGGGP